jgi:hypothetical protein
MCRMSPKRQPPFDRWPVQHVDPHYGYAWYCGRGLIVSHIMVTHGTVAAAHAYHDFEGRIMEEQADEIAEAGGIYVVHDWRTMVTYDGESRRVWQSRMQLHKKGYLRGSTVVLLKAMPLLRMAVQAVNLVASMTNNGKVEIMTDIDAALAAHEAEPPALSRRF